MSTPLTGPAAIRARRIADEAARPAQQAAKAAREVQEQVERDASIQGKPCIMGCGQPATVAVILRQGVVAACATHAAW